MHKHFLPILLGVLGALTLNLSPALAQPAPEPAAKAPAPAAAAATPEAPAAAAAAAPTPAVPEGPTADEMAKAKEHFMKGKELFDTKDFENAVDEFKESFKLSKNPVLLYNIAFTHDEIGDKQMALFYYEKFLRDTGKAAANRGIAKGRVRTLKREAKGEDPSAMKAVTSFKHTAIDESPPNTPLDVTAVVPEGVPWRVVLNYRGAGKVKFTSVEMHYRYKELVARVPAAATKGKNVQYYIEVRDGNGKVLERAGQPTSPNIIYMEEGAKPRFYADIDPTKTPTPSHTPSGANFGNGGWTDSHSSKFQNLKWGATGGAAGLVLLSATFYLISTGAANELESESIDSRGGGCLTGPPCTSFAQRQKDLQSKGKTYETLGTVSLGLGLAVAAGAGALWYLELTNNKPTENMMTTVPVVGDDYVGAAAALRF